MSLNYVDHQRTRYLKSHYEIYDHRKDKIRIEEELENSRREVHLSSLCLICTYFSFSVRNALKRNKKSVPKESKSSLKRINSLKISKRVLLKRNN